tara:strand:- start:450 stop:605 length:156 start_codon:yes stop_codon:yes gene_type:complete
MIPIKFEEFLSVGQISTGISGTYGNAAWRTIPRIIEMPLRASRPWNLDELS